MLKGLQRISAALSVFAALATATHAQTPAANPNQATANAVAAALRSSPALQGQRIDIEAVSGQVTLIGNLANQAQHRAALARAQRVAGVTAVVDRLRVHPDARVRPAQYQGGETIEGAPMIAGGGPLMTATPMTMMDGSPAGPMGGPMGGEMGGPMPEGVSGGASVTGQPALSNYAWPGYAPMPNANASATGYPTTYPWQSWTSVRPPYPMPEIPYEWRAVTLRWDDGIWWLDFKKHYDRPFFTPWPFQIFAY